MRSMLSVVLGYVVMLVAVLAGQMAFTALGLGLMAQPGEQPDTGYFAFNLTTGFFFLMIGGDVPPLFVGPAGLNPTSGFAAALKLMVLACIVSSPRCQS